MDDQTKLSATSKFGVMIGALVFAVIAGSVVAVVVSVIFGIVPGMILSWITFVTVGIWAYRSAKIGKQ